jgi:hypothetical protein
VTSKVVVAVRVTPLLVPCTVRGYEPVGVVPLVVTVIVVEPGPVRDGGAKEAVAPAGRPVTANVVDPLKPLIALTLVVD